MLKFWGAGGRGLYYAFSELKMHLVIANTMSKLEK